MDKRGNLFEALFAEFVTPPILQSGAQGSRLAENSGGGLWVAKAFGRAKALARLQAKPLFEYAHIHNRCHCARTATQACTFFHLR